MLEVKNLSKTYSGDGQDFQALSEVDLQITNGECVAIVGKSGSGKSTLMHVLACLDEGLLRRGQRLDRAAVALALADPADRPRDLAWHREQRDAAIADLDWFLETKPAGIDLDQIRKMQQFFRDNKPERIVP